MTEQTIRVIVAEDQWMIRDGLAALAEIAPNIEVVATAGDGIDAVRLAQEHVPDVMLMDIKMPNLGGLEATRQIKETNPSVQVLVLTTFVESDLIVEALDAGAVGYLTKDIEAADLAEAVSTAARGIVQLTPAVAARLVSATNRARGDATLTSSVIETLTARERDVLRLIAKGMRNPGIAEHLHLSSGTVKNHVSAILLKLGVPDRTSAAILATKHGLT